MKTRPAEMLMLSALLLATLFFPLPANADTPEVLAMMESGKYGVEWHPTVDYDSITLRVSGPSGLYFQEEFSANEFPYFDYYDEKNSLRPDGVYTYELVFSPTLKDPIRKALDTVRTMPKRELIAERFKERGDLPIEDLVQTGTFSMQGGTVLLADVVEGKVPKTSDADVPGEEKDVVHVEDTIVQGSLCTGIDCNNGENFGFDTIRLKENNLRIRFTDTSSSGSFPTNDWQLTANDSANGGQNKFSIDDIDNARTPFTVEAGTRSNALYLDSSGRVGLGTSTPAEDLHIWYGDTPTIRLDQSGSGWAPQTWDIAGNEANFFIRDVNNGSKLPLRIQPNAPTNSLFIKNGGDIGLGTQSPGAGLHLRRTGASAILRIENTGNGNHSGIEFTRERLTGTGKTGAAIWVASDTSTNGSDLILQSNTSTAVGNPCTSDGKRLTLSTQSGFLFENGNVGIGNTSPSALLEVGTGGAICNGTTWSDGSSREFKKNIEGLSEEDIAHLFDALEEVDLVKFQYKGESDASTPRVGMIAEEMPDILASEDRKRLELGRHIGFLMAVVKTMHEQNMKLTQEVSELKSQMETFKAGQVENPGM